MSLEPRYGHMGMFAIAGCGSVIRPMMIKTALAAIAVTFGLSGDVQAASETTLIKCGASTGTAYRFDGNGWQSDGMSKGQIVLVSNAGGVEGEFDIRFEDSIGAYGYIRDGAVVFKAQQNDEKFSFVAAHSNYIDQYTFDFSRNEVVWTSHRTLSPHSEGHQRVAMFYSECGN
jgi:hypothetical protein